VEADEQEEDEDAAMALEPTPEEVPSTVSPLALSGSQCLPCVFGCVSPSAVYKPIAELVNPEEPRSSPAQFLYVPIRCRFQVSLFNRSLKPLTLNRLIAGSVLVVRRIAKPPYSC
jgi:hypothetical protein